MFSEKSANRSRPSVPFESRINLLPPSLSCGGNRQFLRRERIGQVKLRLGYASAVVLFDGAPSLHDRSPLRSNYRTSTFNRFQAEGQPQGAQLQRFSRSNVRVKPPNNASACARNASRPRMYKFSTVQQPLLTAAFVVNP